MAVLIEDDAQRQAFLAEALQLVSQEEASVRSDGSCVVGAPMGLDSVPKALQYVMDRGRIVEK